MQGPNQEEEEVEEQDTWQDRIPLILPTDQRYKVCTGAGKG
jgi:hypothetical protein